MTLTNSAMILAFASILLAGAGYFLLRRTLDLFAVAFGGCAFYFIPLLVGHVPDWNVPNPFAADVPLASGVYLVGYLSTAAVIVGAAIFDKIASQVKTAVRPMNSLANWYLLISLAGLIGSILTGHILDMNKTFVLTQVGYWFILFETAATLAWIDALLSRKRAQLTLASLLLLFDLAIGFRFMTVMCFLSFTLVQFGRGEARLWRSMPRLAAAAVAAFFLLLMINNIREVFLPRLGMTYTEIKAPPRTVAETSVASQPLAAVEKMPTRAQESLSDGLLRLGSRIPRLLQQMEPFVTQAILSETIRQDFRCSPQRYRNLAFIIPFSSRFFGTPETFETQFKPKFFPRHRAGMAGNAWAETFCDFGYLGIVAEAVMIVLLVGLAQILIDSSASSFVSAVILSGVVFAFYFHRNDMLFELLLIRRVLMIFAIAWCLSYLFRWEQNWQRLTAPRNAR